MSKFTIFKDPHDLDTKYQNAEGLPALLMDSSPLLKFNLMLNIESDDIAMILPSNRSTISNIKL